MTDLTIRMDVAVPEAEEIDFDSALPVTTGKAIPILTMALSEMEKYIDKHTTSLFDRLVAERQAMKMIEHTVELLRTERDNLLGSALDMKGMPRVLWENYVVTRREGSKPRQTLDRTKLMNATDDFKCPNCGQVSKVGVTPYHIAQGTKVGNPGKPGVTIRALDDKEEDE